MYRFVTLRLVTYHIVGKLGKGFNLATWRLQILHLGLKRAAIWPAVWARTFDLYSYSLLEVVVALYTYLYPSKDGLVLELPTELLHRDFSLSRRDDDGADEGHEACSLARIAARFIRLRGKYHNCTSEQDKVSGYCAGNSPDRASRLGRIMLA